MWKYWYICIGIYFLNYINYWGLNCIVRTQKLLRIAVQYYSRSKYKLLTNINTYRYWCGLINNVKFVILNMYVKITFLGFGGFRLQLHYDLRYLKYGLIRQSKGVSWYKYYRQQVGNRLNIMSKLWMKVKLLRRDWNKILVSSRKAKHISRVYLSIYRHYYKNDMWRFINLYVMLIGSKMLTNLKWLRTWDMLRFCAVEKVQSDLIMQYIGFSKRYLYHWIMYWQQFKRQKLFDRYSAVNTYKYLWCTFDIPQYLEVDYLTCTTFRLLMMEKNYLLHTFICIYLHWEFITLYNWKHLY